MKAAQELSAYAKGELAVKILNTVADKRLEFTDMIVRALMTDDVIIPALGDLHQYLLVQVSEWVKEYRNSMSVDRGIKALDIIEVLCREVTQVAIQRDFIALSFQVLNDRDQLWGIDEDLKSSVQLLNIVNEIYELNLNPSQNVA